MVMKFLYFVAGMIVLVLTGAFVVRVYEKELTEYALVPDTKFEKQTALATSIYDDPKMWFAMGRNVGPENPVKFVPQGAPETKAPGQAAIFFIHPTSYMEKTHWNAPLDDQLSQNRAKLFLRGMASAFAPSGEIWAPRYRQAAIGAFLTVKPEGQQALNAAYQDVLQAPDAFVERPDCGQSHRKADCCRLCRRLASVIRYRHRANGDAALRLARPNWLSDELAELCRTCRLRTHHRIV